MSNYVISDSACPVPAFCEKTLDRMGKNPYGKPLYRVVWAPSVREISGGLWGDTGDIEYRLVQKYDSARWVLEKWIPAEKYGDPDSWERQTMAEGNLLSIGPFPHRGQYEHCFTFEAHGTYVPVTPEFLDSVVCLIDAGKLFTDYEKALALREREEKKASERRKMVADVVDDAQSPFSGVAIGYGGNSHVKKAEDVKIKYSAQDLPQKFATNRGVRQL